MRVGDIADPRLMQIVRRMRIRLLRDHRVRTGMVDRPITGVAAIGLGVWLLAPGRSGAGAAQLNAGAELIALGRAIHARRDFPSLRWEQAVAEAERAHHQLDVAAALAKADTLTLDACTERIIEVVRSLRDVVA